MDFVREIMREWYLLLSQTSVSLSAPVKAVADSAEIPLVTVFLLGLVGALSPCQLTTNLSAIAYVSRNPQEADPWREALAYTLAKVLVYALAGGAIIFLGLRLERGAIPVVVAARKIIGPLMILIGLELIGLIRLRGSFGAPLARRLQSRLPQRGAIRAFSLGVAFSFTFCPTLFWLFFGLTIPLALGSAGGWTFPGVFALGTAIPLLAFAGLLPSGTETSGRLAERLSRSPGLVTRISGVIFILAGINDTLTYWFI